MKTIFETGSIILRVRVPSVSAGIIELHTRDKSGQWESREIVLTTLEWGALRDFFKS